MTAKKKLYWRQCSVLSSYGLPSLLTKDIYTNINIFCFMDSDAPGVDKTQFGSDFHYLWRIQNILDKSASASVRNDMYLWFRLLCALKREISIKMTDKEKKDFTDRILKISDLIGVYAFAQDYSKEAKTPKLASELYLELDSYQQDLLSIADKFGLLLKTIKQDELDDY